MEVSVVCTLKNEAKSVRRLLGSLLSQSRMPNEIVITDGGSTDGTIEIVSSYIEEGSPINLIIAQGINISQGRNIAIKNAKHDYIAVTDGGCRADKNWLRNLIKPFDEDPAVDVVSGFYLPEFSSTLEEYLGELVRSKLKNEERATFLPSGRSMAFRKESWERVHAFPERLDKGEDTFFALALREAGCRFALARDAVVYWRPRSSFGGLFRQYYHYARGEAQAGICSADRGYMVSYLYNILKCGLSLLMKGRVACLVYAPLIALTLFLAHFTGRLVGNIKRPRN